MQNFEGESLKRSHSTTKTIHNLRPSILFRSNSQSSMFQTRKFNNTIQSTDKSISKPSPAKVNFIYNQSSNQTSNYAEEHIKAEKLQDRKKQLKKERKTFLNVISKQSVPQQIIKFVYGNNQPNLSRHIAPTQTQPTSIQTLLTFKHHPFDDSNQQTQRKKQKDQIKNPLIDDSLLESFPSAKLKKSKNSSAFKSTENKAQLPQNFKIQIDQEVNSFTQDVLTQQIKELNVSNENYYSNQLQNKKTARQTTVSENQQRETTQKLTFNDTIKLNSLLSENQHQKHAIANTQSTANQSFMPFSISQNDERRNFKNETQKISEFLLCDEQNAQPSNNPNKTQGSNQDQKLQEEKTQEKIQKDSKIWNLQNMMGKKVELGYNEDTNAISQVPIFEIKLKDLKEFTRKQLLKIRSQDQTIQRQQKVNQEKINPFIKKREPMQQCDKLGENLNVLGLNIQGLAKTIQRFPLKNEFTDLNKKKSIHQKERSAESSENKVNQQLNVKQSSMLRQKTIQIAIKVETDKNLQDRNSDKQEYNRNSDKQEYNRNSDKQEYKMTEKNTQVNDIAQKDDPYVNEFIPCEQEETNRNKYQKIALPKQSTKQVEHIQMSQTYLNKNNNSERTTDTSKINIQNNKLMGSLEVVQTYDQSNPLSNSLRNFYSIPENSLQFSPETSNFIQNPDQAQANFKYPESLFPQNSLLKTDINMKTYKATKETKAKLYQNYPNSSPKRQYLKTHLPFQKSYNKRNILNENSTKSNPSFVGSPQRKISNFGQFSSDSKTKMLELINSNQKSSQNENQEAKRELNYEMYKTLRSKSVAKQYTKIVIDQSKSRVIELPLMQAPVQIDGSKLIYPKYIKNKVYYVKS